MHATQKIDSVDQKIGSTYIYQAQQASEGHMWRCTASWYRRDRFFTEEHRRCRFCIAIEVTVLSRGKEKNATLQRDSVTSDGIESCVRLRSPTTAARPPQWPRNLPCERRVAATGGGGRAGGDTGVLQQRTGQRRKTPPPFLLTL